MDRVYRIVVRVVVFVLRVMRWGPTVSGLENVPTEGPALIASNHISLVDWIFLGRGVVPIKRLIRFMAMKEAFDHWLGGPLLRVMRHLPVDRVGSPEQAIAPAVEALKQGELVGIFPEGVMSRSFVPAGARTGAARIAMEAGAPIIPAAVWGSHRILSTKRLRGLLQPGIPVSVRYGEPIPYQPDEDATVVSERLMAGIRRLAEELMAEYPQQPRSEKDRWWLPAHRGGTAPTVEESERHAAERRERRKAEREAKGAD